MKFGITGVNAGMGVVPEYAAGFARAAEEHGIESLWTVEHVVVPAGYDSTYPYSKTGKMPGGEDVPITDPLVWLSYVAAVTNTIKLGTAIIILPQRNPVVFAKEVATLDVLSAGRVLLGVGIGWLREEFDAIGVPFDARGARTDDYVEAMRVLWREPVPTYRGRFASFEGAKQYPKPAQSGGVPIVIGGHTEAAARRAGRIGDGFFPWGIKPPELPALLDAMRAGARDVGRDPDAIEVTCGGPPDPERIKAYADLGVARYVTSIMAATVDDVRRELGSFAGDVMAKV